MKADGTPETMAEWEAQHKREREALRDKVARAICRESCSHYGEPACFEVVPDAWPNPNCDEPGCIWLAEAAIDAVKA